MKRKVVMHGPATLIVSLPSKWVKQQGLKRGDEVEVSEEGGKLCISTEKKVELKTVEIDITGLDRTSIVLLVQGIYKKGYDEFTLRFRNPLTQYFRLGTDIEVPSVIHYVVGRLVGIEIIEQKNDYVVIRDISLPSPEEFDVALRRIFLLLKDASRDFMLGIKNKDVHAISSMEFKHDNITKFSNYCQRLLNKRTYRIPENSHYMFHVIATLDKIADVLKYSARYILEEKVSVRRFCASIIEGVNWSLETYSTLFYKYDLKIVCSLYENRNRIIANMRGSIEKLSAPELLIAQHYSHILEYLMDITESRMGMEY